MGNERLTLQIDTVTTGTQEVDALTGALNKVVSIADRTGKSLQSAGSGNPFSNYPALIKQSIQDPLGAAEATATKFLASLSGTAAIGGGVIAVLGGIGLASLSATRNLAALGVETQAMSLKTGLSTKEVGAFSFAAKAAGSDASIFQTAMRKLADGLVDGGAEGKKAANALADLGVRSRNLDGSIRPIGQIFEDFGSKLAGIESPAKRAQLVVDAFGRSGIELIPTLLTLNQHVKEFNALGGGISEGENKKLLAYNDQLVQIGARWDILVRKAKEGIAGTFTLNFISGTLDFLVGKKGSSPVSDIRDPRRMGSALIPSAPGLPPEWADSTRGFLASAAGGDAVANRIARGESSTPEGIGAKITQLTEDRSNLVAASRPGAGVGEAAMKENESKLRALDSQIAKLKEQQKSMEAVVSQSADLKKRAGEITYGDLPYSKIINSLVGGNRAVGSDAFGNAQVLGAKALSDEIGKASKLPLTLTGFAGAGYRDESGTPQSLTPHKFQSPVLGTLSPSGDLENDNIRAANESAQRVARSITQDAATFHATQRGVADSSISSVNDLAQRQSRMVAIGAEPGDELKIAQQQFAIRAQAVQLEKQILESSRAAYATDEQKIELAKKETDLAKQAQDNTIEYMSALAEYQAKQKESVRQFAGGFYDAAISRTPNAIPNFLRSQAQDLGKTITENATQYIYPAIKKNLIPASSSPFLKGTVFEKGPSKDAALLGNTGALDNARRSIDNLSNILTGKTDSSSTGTDSGSITSPASGSPPSLLSLATSATGGGGGLLSSIPLAAKVAALFGGGAVAGISGSALYNSMETSRAATQASLLGAVPGDIGDGLPMASGKYGASAIPSSSVLGGQGFGFNARTAGALAAAGTGAFAAFSDFRSGGAKNDIAGVGAALGSAAGVAALFGPAGAPVALGLGIASMATSFISAILPDPHVLRQNAIAKELSQGQYIAPQALNVTQSSDGTFASFDARGNLRTSNFSAVPSVRQGSIWEQTHGLFGGPPTFYNVPGGQTSQFGASIAPTTVVNHNYAPGAIQTIDAKSFGGLLQRHGADVENIVTARLQNSHSSLSAEISRAARTS